MLQPTQQVGWLNPRCDASDSAALISRGFHFVEHAASGTVLLVRRDPVSPEASPKDHPVEALPAPVPLPACTRWSPRVEPPLTSHYMLDGASPLPALALAPKPGERVLDLCAAPGGKSLVLAGQLFANGSAPPATGSLLVSNDRSRPRRARLRRVLSDYLGSTLTAEDGAVRVTGFDATYARIPTSTWPDYFDKILVDAPCSSERHVMHGSAGATWSASRLKRDAKQQQQILRAAVRRLNPDGGVLVYSTCSIAPVENDGVISKLLTHASHGAGLECSDPLGALGEESLKLLLAGVEQTPLGAIVLPDSSGFGPLYWSVLRCSRGALGQPDSSVNSFQQR